MNQATNAIKVDDRIVVVSGDEFDGRRGVVREIERDIFGGAGMCWVLLDGDSAATSAHASYLRHE